MQITSWVLIEQPGSLPLQQGLHSVGRIGDRGQRRHSHPSGPKRQQLPASFDQYVQSAVGLTSTKSLQRKWSKRFSARSHLWQS